MGGNKTRQGDKFCKGQLERAAANRVTVVQDNHGEDDRRQVVDRFGLQGVVPPHLQPEQGALPGHLEAPVASRDVAAPLEGVQHEAEEGALERGEQVAAPALQPGHGVAAGQWGLGVIY